MTTLLLNLVKNSLIEFVLSICLRGLAWVESEAISKLLEIWGTCWSSEEGASSPVGVGEGSSTDVTVTGVVVAFLPPLLLQLLLVLLILREIFAAAPSALLLTGTCDVMLLVTSSDGRRCYNKNKQKVNKNKALLIKIVFQIGNLWWMVKSAKSNIFTMPSCTAFHCLPF